MGQPDHLFRPTTNANRNGVVTADALGLLSRPRSSVVMKSAPAVRMPQVVCAMYF